jgi:hypothetical protein
MDAKEVNQKKAILPSGNLLFHKSEAALQALILKKSIYLI